MNATDIRADFMVNLSIPEWDGDIEVQFNYSPGYAATAPSVCFSRAGNFTEGDAGEDGEDERIEIIGAQFYRRGSARPIAVNIAKLANPKGCLYLLESIQYEALCKARRN